MTEPAPLAAADLPERLRVHIRGNETGPVIAERHETDAEKAERLAIAQDHRANRWRARRPLLYEDASMAEFVRERGTPEAQRVAEWLGSDSATLVLAGPVGTGKTYAAYAVGNMAVLTGLWCEAWSISDLLEAMRPNGSGAYGVRDCDLLVLDDLTANDKAASDWAVETLTALVDARTREGRRQVVTTNAPALALETAWGGRLMDRLAWKMTAVTLTGDSRRRGAW